MVSYHYRQHIIISIIMTMRFRLHIRCAIARSYNSLGGGGKFATLISCALSPAETKSDVYGRLETLWRLKQFPHDI